MNARSFLESMRARGVYFFAQGGRLQWFAPSQLLPDDVTRAGALKTELKALVEDVTLEALCSGADPEEAAYIREERAAILEHDGGLCRMEAELWAGVMVPTESRIEPRSTNRVTRRGHDPA